MATAFAVYSADDNSLNFYKRDTVPTAGSSFNGKTATAVYTGIETDTYDNNTDDTDGAVQLPWYDNCTAITSVSFVDNGIAPVSTAFWFFNMNNASLTAINGLDKLDTFNVTNMIDMFYNCSALTSLDLSHFDTSKVKRMRRMFRGCFNLTSLDVSSFDTSKVTSMIGMFAECHSLTSLDVSRWNTSKVDDMGGMFRNCFKLTSLDISRFDTSKVMNMDQMFQGCSALSTIYAGDGWSTAKVTSSNSMFHGCSELPNFSSSVVDKTNAHYNSGGYLTYKSYILEADKVKVVLEKGAVDIIVNTIKEIESSIPAYTSADEGKFLRVVNGVPAWISISA